VVGKTAVNSSRSSLDLLKKKGHGKPGKSWNLRISFFKPGKSWNLIVGP